MKQQIPSLQSFCTKRCEKARLPQLAARLTAGGAALVNTSRAPQCAGAARCTLISRLQGAP